MRWGAGVGGGMGMVKGNWIEMKLPKWHLGIWHLMPMSIPKH